MGKSIPLVPLALALSPALALVACKTGEAAPRADERVSRGQALYGTLCARCHGAEGGGGVASEGAPAPRNLRDHSFQLSVSDAQLEQTIAGGKPPAMPAFGAIVSPEQRTSLVAFLRTLDSETGHGR